MKSASNDVVCLCGYSSIIPSGQLCLAMKKDSLSMIGHLTVRVSAAFVLPGQTCSGCSHLLSHCLRVRLVVDAIIF